MPYYSYCEINGYQKLFNFINAPRAIGKTFGLKTELINRTIKKNKKKTIFLTRYGSDIKNNTKAFSHYFDDVNEKAFPNDIIEVKGTAALFNGKEFALFYPLSWAQRAKYLSWYAFDRIVFDELIAEGVTRYLPNEASILINYFDTVDRRRGITKFYGMSNSVTVSNPYFDEFGFNLDPLTAQSGFYFPKDKNRSAILHYISKDDFYKDVLTGNASEFINTIKNTNYGAYALGGKFLLDNYDGIEKLPTGAQYLYTVTDSINFFGVWRSDASEKIYITEKTLKDFKTFNVDKRFVLGAINDKHNFALERLGVAFKHSLLRFETVNIKNKFFDLLLKII